MAETVTIQLDIEKDLKFNDDGSVGLNITGESSDTVSINDDGLYVKAPSSSSASSIVFEGSYDNEGLRVGANCPFGRADNPDIEKPLMITCTEKVHKVFTATDSTGKTLTGFRPEIDCVLTGDLFRVPVYNTDPGAGSGTSESTTTVEDMRAAIVAKIKSDVGKHKDEALGYQTTDDWCARYVYRVLIYVGFDVPGDRITGLSLEDPDNAYVTYLWQNVKGTGAWNDIDMTNDYPQAGDLILIDRNHIQEERPLDHIGIVEKYSDGTITYIDGNGHGSNYVERRTISRTDADVMYLTRYNG